MLDKIKTVILAAIAAMLAYVILFPNDEPQTKYLLDGAVVCIYYKEHIPCFPPGMTQPQKQSEELI